MMFLRNAGAGQLNRLQRAAAVLAAINRLVQIEMIVLASGGVCALNNTAE
jgi:isopentenyl diphosphate isomerase/L-lactate dehydrogenase-like FMN-dependent dehydrogenase